ncbi:hypothetical protein KDW_37230 [Dictyobacter vulcani]|uniref:CobQ/CobB/MinD/ParA nucleotide binding domain-containing protein n=1 Tax=Dictyobacter vulcani TaxID=2607529 RepID=A0A5J4KSZ2_9CHLR|nr:alpha/beta fold hydrolase [Dictyobacter vulcani]GER89561.1 hypothetical protein KDW_37230 [Dictyobacter vulcani]
MTTGQYLQALSRRWKLILLCILLVGPGAYLGSKLIVPRYQATTIIQLVMHSEHNPLDTDSLTASDQLVRTQAQLAISIPVLREVASHYSDLSIEQLAKNVSVNARAGTQLFSIDVLDPDPWRAAAIANNVALILIKQQIALIQQNKSFSLKQIQQDLKQTHQQIADADKQRARLATTKDNEIEQRAMDARIEDLHLHYNQLQSLLAQLEITEAQGSTFLHIVQPAQPATTPSQPDIRLNTAIGLLAGLLLGLLLALLREHLDPRVYSEEALAKMVDWPMLATIWRETARTKKQRKQKETLLLPEEKSANIEAYRLLRANVGLLQTQKPLRSIAIISATPQDGKSTIAANLAIFMARAGKKTLLVDADMRRPTLEKKFQLATGQKGLSNAVQHCLQEYRIASSTRTLQGQVTTNLRLSLHDYIYPTDTLNLSIMPAGSLPPNPPELLDSKAMNGVIAQLAASDFETIIFDTPPLLGLSDTNILLAKVDGVLIVVDSTKIDKKSIRRMQTLLGQYANQVLGCIINKQKHRSHEIPDSYYRNQPDADDELLVTANKSRDRSKRGFIPGKRIEQLAKLDTQPQQTISSQPQEGYLTVEDDIHLYYKVLGNRPESIIIPAASWLAADLDALAREYTLIFYDQRGRGKSDTIVDAAKIGMQHDVNDLEAIRRHFHVTRCSLLGWSYLGGTTALYSMQHPERVNCLILVAPMALRYGEYEDTRDIEPDKRLDPQAIKRLEEMLANGIDKKDPGTYNREYIKATRLPRQMGRPAALAQMKSDPWVSSNEWPDTISAFFEKFAASMGEWDWRGMAARLEVPTLIIHGAEDLIPPASSKEWAEILPNNRLLIIPEVGHYPWLESPDIFLTAVAGFMKDTEAQKSEPSQKVGMIQSRRKKG